jgi:hypothetical protein
MRLNRRPAPGFGYVLFRKQPKRNASKTARLVNLLQLLGSPWLRKRLCGLRGGHVSPLNNEQGSASHRRHRSQCVLTLDFFVVNASTQAMQKQAPAAHITANDFNV